MGSSGQNYRQKMPYGRQLPIVLDCVPYKMPDVSTSGFHTTSWTLVALAAVHPDANSREALARLCQTYWQPVYAFIRRNGYDGDQSQDLCQGFFALLLEKNYLLDADRERGRFRSFLLTSVKHFLANEWDRTQALKRGGGHAFISIDKVEAERWYAPAAIDETTPESLFERRWAFSLLERVMAKLRAEFAAAGKGDQFDKLAVFLNRERDSARYDEAARQLETSAATLRVAVHRMRQRCRKLLREEIADTVSTAEQADDEIRFLLTILSG